MAEDLNLKFQTMLNLVVNPTGINPVYNSILLVNAHKKHYKFLGASGCLYPSTQKINAEYSFRIASITKTFVATIILQLMEEGFLELNDKFIHFADRSKYPSLNAIHCIGEFNFTSSIAVHHLLQHTSGLRDYFSDDSRFVDFVQNNPPYKWDASSIIHKYFEFGLDKKALFKPGEDFYYSDTNYVLLAVLIEELTGQPLHEALEERIFQPLKLNDTYLEFYQQPKTNALRTFPFQGKVSLQKVNTSFDWGGGGLVSTVCDLDVFIRSLINAELFKLETTVETMMNFTSTDRIQANRNALNYGLGLQKKEIRARQFIGHSGFYGVMMYYDFINQSSIILTINQSAAMQKSEWLLRKAVETLEELNF